MTVNGISDVATQELDLILEKSQVRRPVSLVSPLMLIIVVAALLVTLPAESPWMQPLVPLALAVLVFASVRRAAKVNALHREEGELLRQADEGLRLSRWPEAREAITKLLGRPPMRPGVRYQALIYLGGLLNRLGRYGDAVRLCEQLLKEVQFPEQIQVSLKVMRGYALMREEQLSDAYEAISELKRSAPKGAGAVSMLELYYQVKTGHHEDALVYFEQRRGEMAAQLGHRVADGWALAATSAAALGRGEQATVMAANAAVLGDSQEIARRYPECAAVLAEPQREAVAR